MIASSASDHGCETAIAGFGSSSSSKLNAGVSGVMTRGAGSNGIGLDGMGVWSESPGLSFRLNELSTVPYEDIRDAHFEGTTRLAK